MSTKTIPSFVELYHDITEINNLPQTHQHYDKRCKRLVKKFTDLLEDINNRLSSKDLTRLIDLTTRVDAIVLYDTLSTILNMNYENCVECFYDALNSMETLEDAKHVYEVMYYTYADSSNHAKTVFRNKLKALNIDEDDLVNH